MVAHVDLGQYVIIWILENGIDLLAISWCVHAAVGLHPEQDADGGDVPKIPQHIEEQVLADGAQRCSLDTSGSTLA